MKPKNFPARKLRRQLDAARDDRHAPYSDEEVNRLYAASMVRSKKQRGGRG